VRFFEQETTRASYDVFEGWVRQHGLPGSLYVDRDSIYRCEGRPVWRINWPARSANAIWPGDGAVGVELILANSPQAKGRVERMNGVLQDRLVKALRLAGLVIWKAPTVPGRNVLGEFNRRFGRVAASR